MCQWPECSLRKSLLWVWCKTESNLFRSSSELKFFMVSCGSSLWQTSIPYKWGASLELNQGWLGRVLAFWAVANKKQLLVLALGLCPGSTFLHILLFVSSTIQTGKIQQKQSARNMNHSLPLKSNWILCCPSAHFCQALTSQWAAEPSLLTNLLAALTFSLFLCKNPFEEVNFLLAGFSHIHSSFSFYLNC